MQNTYKMLIIFITLTLAGIIYYLCSSHHIVRYAVFAGYNADKTIHPYIITYLKGLNEISDGVVYIADSELLDEEYKKLEGLVIHTEHIRHEGYDWGSYKRGFNWLKENGYLKKADEIIFANDSCYAPIPSFKPMFNDMKKRSDLDFWGDGKNNAHKQHLQSYFMVFRKKVINSKAFSYFIKEIKKEDNYRKYVIRYELELAPYLQHLGYKWDSWIPYDKIPTEEDYTDINHYPLTLIRDFHHPFLKRRTFTTQLTIREDIPSLMRYLHQYYPKHYQEIIQEISPNFIPDDLKEE